MLTDDLITFDEIFNPEFRYYQEADDLRKTLIKLNPNLSATKHSVKSVLTPTAQTATKLQDWSTSTNSILLSNVNRLLVSDLPTYVKAITELISLHGLRISEALNIKHSDIDPTGRIYIQGLKGSKNRIIQGVKYSNYWIAMSSTPLEIPSYFNRFYFYRLFKSYNIYIKPEEDQNASVTHSLRYAYIISLLASGVNVLDLQLAIGHQSIKSTFHYINKIIQNGW